MSNQDAFLARVRRALRKEAVPPSGRLPLLGEEQSVQQAAAAVREHLTAQRQALIGQVQHELSAVGGRVTCVSSVAAATAYVTQLARDKNVTLVIRWPAELLQALEVDAALQQYGIAVQVADWGADLQRAEAASGTLLARRQKLRALLAQAGLGLSGVDAVIAETGTLALSTLPGQMRSVSLVPPVHVAVARTDQIVPTMADYLLRLRTTTDWQRQLTSCVSFITGPSRTGDIELKLTVGVHGPGELYLILIDEPATKSVASG